MLVFYVRYKYGATKMITLTCLKVEYLNIST